MSKAETTLRLIRTQGYERVILFCNTKVMCQRLCDDFQRAGANAECIHGDIKQSLRERTMQKFHRGAAHPHCYRCGFPGHRRRRCGLRHQLRRAGGERVLYPPHRPDRAGKTEGEGIFYHRNFPEKAKLDEIAKYSNFTIRPMLLGEDGTLMEEVGEGPCDPEAVPVNPREAGFSYWAPGWEIRSGILSPGRSCSAWPSGCA